MTGSVEEERRNLLDWVGTLSTHKNPMMYDAGHMKGHIPGFALIRVSSIGFGPPGLAVTSSPVPWLHGGPGIGKTHLSASIIKYPKTCSSQFPTAFFMSTHANSQRDQTISILRSFVYQLMAQSEHSLHITKGMKPETGDAVPTTLWGIFRAILSKKGLCYLIIDGYDECMDYDPELRSSRKGALQGFMKELLKSTKSTEAKILIVSRNPTLSNLVFTTVPMNQELIE